MHATDYNERIVFVLYLISHPQLQQSENKGDDPEEASGTPVVGQSSTEQLILLPELSDVNDGDDEEEEEEDDGLDFGTIFMID